MERNEVKYIYYSLLKELTGQILEVGFGDPVFFEKFSPAAVVSGLETSDLVISQTNIVLNQRGLGEKVKIYKYENDLLPIQDNSMDCVVSSFCYCCIKNPVLVIKELKRILKTDGKILFIEHIRSEGIFGTVLDLSTPLYAMLNKNCHLNRNVLKYFGEAGFQSVLKIQSEERFIPWLLIQAKNIK
jgi:SAM-dependent methyltransferase